MCCVGKIYKLVCKKTGYIYIDCTYMFLNEAFDIHKKDYLNWLKDPFEFKYSSFYDIFLNNDYYIDLIEEIEDISIDNILLKKKDYINKYNDICIN